MQGADGGGQVKCGSTDHFNGQIRSGGKDDGNGTRKISLPVPIQDLFPGVVTLEDGPPNMRGEYGGPGPGK